MSKKPLATVNKPLTLQSDNELLFVWGDTDGSNTLSAQELHDLFASLGEEIPLDQWEFAVAYYDQDGDGEINRAEWDAWISDGALVQKKPITTFKRSVILTKDSDDLFAKIDNDKSDNLSAKELA